MINITFATCNEFPAIQPGDAIVARALEKHGVKTIAAPWNGPQEPFESVDAVVIRSAWDYPAAPTAFEAWLKKIESGPLAINSLALMRWNLSKRYLLSLAEKGAPLPPSRLVEPTAASIAAAMDELGLTQAVVKPEYGSTSSGLSVVAREDDDGIGRAAQNLAMPGIVQPLISEITTKGETSFIFFDGDFSHAVTKRPKSGEIRCQYEFGGSTKAIEPPQWAIKEASRIITMLPEHPIYARIDAILLDDTMQLMEVELIEPELFFNYCPEAADQFAAVIMKRI
ncbi:MAG: hypothetical protein JKX88_02270 [Marinicaulis sp.]|nr:hypothetical protein [Marinicaulis sp.]